MVKSMPSILSNELEQSMNRIIRLLVDSYLVKQNPQTLLRLKILSFLPAGTTKAIFVGGRLFCTYTCSLLLSSMKRDWLKINGKICDSERHVLPRTAIY